MSKIDQLDKELTALVDKLKPWYCPEMRSLFGISVYSYGKEDEEVNCEPPYGCHLFDIYAEHIDWHTFNPVNRFIPNEAMSVIRKIQAKMQEIEKEVFDL